MPMPFDLSRFKALIFDVDGTLAETEEIHRRAFNETFAHFGLPWSWDRAIYRDLLKVTGGKERIRHFVDVHAHNDPHVDDSAIVAMHRFKTDRYVRMVAAGECPLRPGVRALIDRAVAQGQRLAIATTTTRSNIEALLASTLGPDSMSWFDAVVAGDEVAKKKPAPDVYLKVLDLLKLPGADCVAIEDSRNGLLSALAAGIPVIATPSVYSSDDEFGDARVVVDSLDQLLEPHTQRGVKS
jgi:HAD superfamily hydrolase (TIGR01509 family)